MPEIKGFQSCDTGCPSLCSSIDGTPPDPVWMCPLADQRRPCTTWLHQVCADTELAATDAYILDKVRSRWTVYVSVWWFWEWGLNQFYWYKTNAKAVIPSADTSDHKFSGNMNSAFRICSLISSSSLNGNVPLKLHITFYVQTTQVLHNADKATEQLTNCTQTLMSMHIMKNIITLLI